MNEGIGNIELATVDGDTDKPCFILYQNICTPGNLDIYSVVLANGVTNERR